MRRHNIQSRSLGHSSDKRDPLWMYVSVWRNVSVSKMELLYVILPRYHSFK